MAVCELPYNNNNGRVPIIIRVVCPIIIRAVCPIIITARCPVI